MIASQGAGGRSRSSGNFLPSIGRSKGKAAGKGFGGVGTQSVLPGVRLNWAPAAAIFFGSA